ncbi:IQ motif containing GTPase activating protein 1 (predicted), isoform CRA_c, partial [Rattus norvegicus]
MSAAEEVDGLGVVRPHYGSVLDNERLTAEEMDERRRQNVAYEYLCHLEEAKRWMEACLGEDLPPTTELEEGLRNGVYLAKLGNFFSPKVVSLKKIYDREQTRYKILAPVVKEIMDDKSLNIKTDPVDIYKSWVNQMESQTGEA